VRPAFELGAQFGEAVLPAEAAQQPGSGLADGAIAGGQRVALGCSRWIVEVRRRMVPSRLVAPYRALRWEGANFRIPLIGVTNVTAS
jgi:hypothetical protein